MFKRVPFATCLIAAAMAALGSIAPAAHAAPLPHHAKTAAACTTTALTDVVDGTNRVSGGGSVNCGASPANTFGVFVELYRGPAGSQQMVAAAANSCVSTPGCYAAVEYPDSQAGQQRFQVKVIFHGTYEGVKWGNVLYH